jgi:ketosteroid isomerase-like protein
MSTQTGKESAVSTAVETLRKAMIAADKATLESLTAAELSYGHSSGRVETRAEFVQAFVSGKSGFSEIALSAQTVSVVDKVALVRHVFDCVHRKDGKKAKLFILTVWVQQQDQWKLLGRQATKL